MLQPRTVQQVPNPWRCWRFLRTYYKRPDASSGKKGTKCAHPAPPLHVGMQTKGEVRSHGSSSGGISNKKRKLSHGSVTLTSDTRPKHLESEITLEPSERVKSNNGMTINKRAGTNKNRHLFVLPGLLHAEALQQQTAPSTQHVDQSQDTPLGSQTDTEIPLSQPLLESQSY